MEITPTLCLAQSTDNDVIKKAATVFSSLNVNGPNAASKATARTYNIVKLLSLCHSCLDVILKDFDEEDKCLHVSRQHNLKLHKDCIDSEEMAMHVFTNSLEFIEVAVKKIILVNIKSLENPLFSLFDRVFKITSRMLPPVLSYMQQRTIMTLIKVLKSLYSQACYWSSLNKLKKQLEFILDLNHVEDETKVLIYEFLMMYSMIAKDMFIFTESLCNTIIRQSTPPINQEDHMCLIMKGKKGMKRKRDHEKQKWSEPVAASIMQFLASIYNYSGTRLNPQLEQKMYLHLKTLLGNAKYCGNLEHLLEKVFVSSAIRGSQSNMSPHMLHLVSSAISGKQSIITPHMLHSLMPNTPVNFNQQINPLSLMLNGNGSISNASESQVNNQCNANEDEEMPSDDEFEETGEINKETDDSEDEEQMVQENSKGNPEKQTVDEPKQNVTSPINEQILRSPHSPSNKDPENVSDYPENLSDYPVIDITNSDSSSVDEEITVCEAKEKNPISSPAKSSCDKSVENPHDMIDLTQSKPSMESCHSDDDDNFNFVCEFK